MSEDNDMILKSIIIKEHSPLRDSAGAQSRRREGEGCMLVGFEDENGRIGLPRAEHTIRLDDLLWIVGEKAAIKKLSNDNID